VLHSARANPEVQQDRRWWDGLAAALAREYATSTPVFWLTFIEGITTSAETLVRQLAQFLLTHGQGDVQPLLWKSCQEEGIVLLNQQIGVIAAALRPRDPSRRADWHVWLRAALRGG
jgi:hypothetical protein